VISIPRVSSIFFRRHDWDGVSIRYDVGVIDFPTAAEKQ